MALSLLQNQVGPEAGGEDVLLQVHQVDLIPHFVGKLHQLCFRVSGVSVEIGLRVAESSLLQLLEPFEVPFTKVALAGIHIDGEVEEIGDEHPPLWFLGRVHLQHIDAFHNQDIRSLDGLYLFLQHIIVEVRIEWHLQSSLPDFTLARKASSRLAS